MAPASGGSPGAAVEDGLQFRLQEPLGTLSSDQVGQTRDGVPSAGRSSGNRSGAGLRQKVADLRGVAVALVRQVPELVSSAD